MSNNVLTHLKFDGNNNDISVIFSKYVLTGDENLPYLDFEKIIPMPKSLKVESSSLENVAIAAYLSAINPDCEYFNNDFKKMSCSDFDKIACDIRKNMFISQTFRMSEKEILSFSEVFSSGVDEMLNAGQQYIDNFIKYGATSWYKWRKNNWGTKWNSYSGIINAANNEIWFQTANNFPEPVIKALSEMYPDLSIIVRYSDENRGANCGECCFKNGAVVYNKAFSTISEFQPFSEALWQQYYSL